MNYTLNDAQMSVLREIADAEMRSLEQMLSILLAEGVTFYYCDYRSPRGDIDSNNLSDKLTCNAHALVDK